MIDSTGVNRTRFSRLKLVNKRDECGQNVVETHSIKKTC